MEATRHRARLVGLRSPASEDAFLAEAGRLWRLPAAVVDQAQAWVRARRLTAGTTSQELVLDVRPGHAVVHVGDDHLALHWSESDVPTDSGPGGAGAPPRPGARRGWTSLTASPL